MTTDGETGHTDGRDLDVEAIHEALESLYSNVELAGCRLAASFPAPDITVVRRAQMLRNLLMDAIEALRPQRPASPQALAARSYQVLSLRYVSGLSVEQIAERIALGERQVYRDLRRAEDDLAQILASRLTAARRTHEPIQSNIQQEMAALSSAAQIVDLSESLQRALTTVRPLATARGIQLDMHVPPQSIPVQATPGLLGQLLVQVFSATIQATKGEVWSVELTQDEGMASVRALFPCPDPMPCQDLLVTVRAMAEAIGGACEVTRAARGYGAVVVRLPVVQPRRVLIIEDNPGVCELYRRTLQDSDWQPTIISDPRAAVESASALQPAAIIMDILMPEMEGWSILQALQVNPGTAKIPVIVCSVIDDSSLALALGAAHSIKKPVSRLELLQVLEQVLHHRSAASRSAVWP